MSSNESVSCRGCRRPLVTYPYAKGRAYLPTGERARVNHYGGFVCSWDCDWRACVELESSMPGAGPARRPGSSAMEQIRSNWPEHYR